MSSLEDSRSSGETAAAKGIALDYLGDIAAALKSYQLRMASEANIATLDEVRMPDHRLTPCSHI